MAEGKNYGMVAVAAACQGQKANWKTGPTSRFLRIDYFVFLRITPYFPEYCNI